ncbi:MAG TPA: hypothetical protein VFR67_21010, partial [Pilimelia sp.]|nr:hypothetical protein [Pilimelia sp.]
MKRTLTAIAATAVLVLGLAGPASAHDFPAPPHQPGPGVPGTALNTPLKLVKIGHINPGPGANADVYGHRGHAYLASWIGASCPSNGIRVYDLSDPAAPRHVSTFADKLSEPDLAGTWTEKVIVQR